MKNKVSKLTESLWEVFIESMTAAHKAGAGELRDYTKNNGYADSLSELLAAETANEKKHRSGYAPAGREHPITSRTAAKILLMNNAALGAKKRRDGEQVPATLYLECRKTAVEAMALGFAAGEHLSDQWRADVQSLDYSEIMKSSN